MSDVRGQRAANFNDNLGIRFLMPCTARSLLVPYLQRFLEAA
jgi:hypothetical protein